MHALIHCSQEIRSSDHTNHTLPWSFLVLHQLKVNGGELNFHVYKNSVQTSRQGSCVIHNRSFHCSSVPMGPAALPGGFLLGFPTAPAFRAGPNLVLPCSGSRSSLRSSSRKVWLTCHIDLRAGAGSLRLNMIVSFSFKLYTAGSFFQIHSPIPTIEAS